MTDFLHDVPQRSADPRVALTEIERRLQGLPGPAGEPVPSRPWPAEPLEPERPAASDRLGEHVWNLDHAKRLDVQEVIVSQRPVLGPSIIRFQRVIHRLTGWYLVPLAHRIQTFHNEVVAALRTVAEAQQLTETRLDRLERLVQVLRLGREDLPRQPALGTRGLLSREPVGFDYQTFEDRFRGSPAAIRERQAPLVDEFRNVPGPVVDLGCGRGEFLTLLVEAGVDAYGIDESPQLVEACRAAGLSTFRDDALTHLAGLPDDYLGGIFASHLIEHLTSADLWSLLRLAAAKLRAGGVLVTETPNPRVLAVSACSFWVDPTHIRPVHPDTAVFLLEQVGFTDLRVRYQAPFPETDRLPRIEAGAGSAPDVERVLAEVIDRLNDLLFGDRDYQVLARRGTTSGPATESASV